MKRVRTLDGLRGVAILLVVAGHTVQHLQPLHEGVRHWLYLFANPNAGVRLFFVLSGYLITELLLREQETSGGISLRAFYWRRVLRIFPAFYVYLLTVTLIDLWKPAGITPQTWVAAASFTWNYATFWVTGPPEGTWNLGHLWTLSVEEQFYLFWPAVLALAGARRGLGIAALLIAWCPLARVGTYFLFPEQRGQLNMMFHTGVDSLMIGCATAMLLRRERVRARLAASGGVLAALAALWLLVLSPLMAHFVRGSPIVVGFTLDALAAAGICAWVHHTPGQSIQLLLGRGPLPALGLISYSLYLWQQLFLGPTGWLAHGNIAAPVLSSFAAALLSYLMIEQPLLRYRTARRQRVASAPLRTHELT
jgi:peptidoglycan/LPS O-acetylase OafA/YrhL